MLSFHYFDVNVYFLALLEELFAEYENNPSLLLEKNAIVMLDFNTQPLALRWLIWTGPTFPSRHVTALRSSLFLSPMPSLCTFHISAG